MTGPGPFTSGVAGGIGMSGEFPGGGNGDGISPVSIGGGEGDVALGSNSGGDGMPLSGEGGVPVGIDGEVTGVANGPKDTNGGWPCCHGFYSIQSHWHCCGNTVSNLLVRYNRHVFRRARVWGDVP